MGYTVDGRAQVELKWNESQPLANGLLRFAHALNTPPPDAVVAVCDDAADAIVDAASAKRLPAAAPAWFGKAPRPAASVAILEEALTLICVAMLPAVGPARYRSPLQNAYP